MTIKNVAQHSGVSVSTVSRVLNNHPDVSDEVRERVWASVSVLHYVPNSTARDLVRPQTDAIGVVVRGAENPFFTGLIRSIEQSIAAADYTMVLHQIREEEDEIRAGAGLVQAKRLRGLIFLGGRFDYTEEETASLQVPFVCCTFTNSFGTLGRSIYSSVSIDDEGEAHRAVQYLLEHGHTKIGVLLDSKTDRSISELRYRGYCRALEEAGIRPDDSLVEETVYYTMEAAYAGTKRLLERRSDLTAIFAIADSFGMAAMKALHEAGKRVPEDCSVMAIDGIDMSFYTIPTLTTLIQPAEEMGGEAVRILTGVLREKNENRHQYLPTTLRKGGSVAKAPET